MTIHQESHSFSIQGREVTMLLATLELFKSGEHFIIHSRQEKGDIALDDRTILVTDSASEVVNGVRKHFDSNPEGRLVSVYVVKGKQLYVIKDHAMHGLYFNHSSKIIHSSALASEIYEHLDFHTVHTLGDLAA